MPGELNSLLFSRNKFQNMVNVGAEMLKHYQKEKIMNIIMNMNI